MRVHWCRTVTALVRAGWKPSGEDLLGAGAHGLTRSPKDGAEIMHEPVSFVGGIYPTEFAARTTVELLKEEGYPPSTIHLAGPDITSSSSYQLSPAADVESVRDMLSRPTAEDAITAGIGAASGAEETATESTKEVSLFLSTPVFEALFAKGYDHLVGPLENAGTSIMISIPDYALLAQEAVQLRFWIVTVEAEQPIQAESIKGLIERTYN